MLSADPEAAALIRPAGPDDAALLHQLIVELAEEERLTSDLKLTCLGLVRELSRARPTARFLIAEQVGQAVGFCAWYYAFSTFEGRSTLFIEDVFVRREARCQGIGGALLGSAARLAWAEGLPRIEWRVQRSNDLAIALFARHGFPITDDWKFCRISPEKVLPV